MIGKTINEIKKFIEKNKTNIIIDEIKIKWVKLKEEDVNKIVKEVKNGEINLYLKENKVISFKYRLL